ncbi:restriction endonuclease subunit S [Candidatus Marinimicrobia bacterium]|nr:restriction endonuclease subunit S [Candidatus Neomarinimicrobiota bacterium]
MSKYWKNTTFGQVTELQQGMCFNKKSNHLLREDGIPVLLIKDLKNNTISQYTDTELTPKRFISKDTDIIYTRTGQVGLVFTNKIGVIHNNSFKISPNKDIYPLFLYWYLKQPSMIKYAKNIAGGSAQPDLGHDAFKSMSFNYPDIKTQKKIVSILSTYDKLIENNTKRIEILEEIAQRIYKEWFVDFKYPGNENDELVDSELGMIPESWELNNLDKFVSFDRGTEPGSKNYQDNKSENTIPFLRVGDLGARSKKIYISKELAKEKILDKKDIVITLDGTVGIVKTGLEGCFSTGLRKCRIINNSINREFLFYTLKSRNIQLTIRAHATGSTILHASSSIKHMKFVLPTNKIMNNFFEMLNPIITEKQILTDKNYNLSKTRDYLLPKLISGKVDVSDLDIDTDIIND